MADIIINDLSYKEENLSSYLKNIIITRQEIRDEYIRQQTIAECIEYFNNKK
jgi:hypothetical protein